MRSRLPGKGDQDLSHSSLMAMCSPLQTPRPGIPVGWEFFEDAGVAEGAAGLQACIRPLERAAYPASLTALTHPVTSDGMLPTCPPPSDPRLRGAEVSPSLT